MKELLQKMVEAGASDLILEADAPLVLRIGGNLQFEKKKYTAEEVSGLILSILTPFQKSRLEKEKQLDLSSDLPSGERFRINLHYQKGSLAVAIRAIPKFIPTKQDLNLPDAIDELASLKSGLIIVTGPTGAGKSTTQAYMIDVINQSRADHIITVEDPIEYVHQNKKSIIETKTR